MARSEETGYGPRWDDVGQGIAAMSRKWGGSWSVRVQSAARLSRPGRLYVLCIRRIGSAEGDEPSEQFSGHEYPCSQYATMPALMLALLDRLDSKLEERKVIRERQTRF